MTVLVPTTDKSGAYAVQAQITSLAAQIATFNSELQAAADAQAAAQLLIDQGSNAPLPPLPPVVSESISDAQHLLDQRQIDLVNTLLDQRRLNADSILSTCPIVIKANPLFARITSVQALVTKYGASPPGYQAAEKVDQLQRQLVSELMSSAALPAATVISTMAYMGGAT